MRAQVGRGLGGHRPVFPTASKARSGRFGLALPSVGVGLGEAREQILAKLRAIYPKVKLSPVFRPSQERRGHEEGLREVLQ